MTTDSNVIYPVDAKAWPLVFKMQAEEIVGIDPEGRIFWRGREVETDADFRGAMLEAVQLMAANTRVVTP